MISVTILTKNNEDTLEDTLKSIQNFDEIIILDTGSTDRTLDIAKKYPNVKVHAADFYNFGQLKNKAARLASNDWILSLDSDEELSEKLAEEILKASHELDANAVHAFTFHNYFNGKHIRWCGWYPDYHVRLYNKNETQFTTAYLHESVDAKKKKVKKFKHPIMHKSYRSIDDFLIKMQRYTTLFAKEYQGKKKSSFSTALLHAGFSFFKSYFMKGGIFAGKEGFIISVYNANTAFYKYLKLEEANKECS